VLIDSGTRERGSIRGVFGRNPAGRLMRPGMALGIPSEGPWLPQLDSVPGTKAAIAKLAGARVAALLQREPFWETGCRRNSVHVRRPGTLRPERGSSDDWLDSQGERLRVSGFRRFRSCHAVLMNCHQSSPAMSLHWVISHQPCRGCGK